jgi:thiamine pyrophosphokinase
LLILANLTKQRRSFVKLGGRMDIAISKFTLLYSLEFRMDIFMLKSEAGLFA